MKSSGLNIMLRDDFFPFGFLLGLSSPILRFLFCFEFVLELFFWDFALQVIVLLASGLAMSIKMYCGASRRTWDGLEHHFHSNF